MDSTDTFQDSPMSPGGSDMSVPPQASSSSSTTKISRGHSCVLCQQRKVKCDRGKPCSNCIKARAECVPSVPSIPRRRRKKIPDTDIAGRLQRCEDLLKKHGIKIEDEDRTLSRRDNGLTTMEMDKGPSLLEPPKDPTLPASQSRYSGTLMSDNGNTHFIENPLWENLREDTHAQEPKDGSSSDDEINGSSLYPDPGSLLIGYTSQKYTLNSQHPPPIQIFRLWQTFLTNVNPLTKLFHAPTVQQIILDASGDLEHVSRPTEALMFSIYLLAVTSMTSEDCENMLGESQSALLSKYSHATQHALLRATYMRSLSLVTLQAYTLFLFALRKFYDPHSLWVLTGAAVRISQRIGLHRDGLSHDLPPFEAEMRRRLWWQIVFLDGHSSKLSGSGFPAWLARFDTKMPLNISDSSLSPGMKELPTEHPGPTEMMFCRVRYEVADALRKAKFGQRDDDNSKVATGAELIAKKDRAIIELKQRIEEKYLQYCDPSIPLHYLCTLMSRAVICTMRVMAHHPRHYPDKGASMPQVERDMLFSETLDLLEFDRLAHTEKNLQGFLWHIHSHFQMDAFIFMLSELRQKTSGEQVERAWRQVDDSYSLHPEMIKDIKNGLFFAIGNLVIKAWENRERAHGRYHLETPSFVTQLRSYRKQAEPSPSVNQNFDESFMRTHINPPNNDLPETGVLAATSQFLSGDSSDLDYAFDPNMMEVSPVDWNYWQTLMDGCDLPNLPDDNMQNFFN